ncbi:HAD family hydrolase [Opitutaceae bacterium EW11]|nr:HAD family hydrolase [Opitutaceae bacterium EW11]
MLVLVPARAKTANLSVRSPAETRQVGAVTRFRTALFDLDGTLLDHFAAIHRTHTQTLAHFGLPAPSMEAVHRAVGGGLETAVRRLFGPGKEALADQAIPVYRSLWPNNLFYEVKLLPGARELLEQLKANGIQRAVFTNKHGPSARAVMGYLKVADLLDGIFGAFDTPWLKPDVRFAEYVLKALDAKPATTCLVGDSTYDVEAARTARLTSFCVTTGTHAAEELQKAGATAVYPDLQTLGKAELV